MLFLKYIKEGPHEKDSKMLTGIVGINSHQRILREYY